MKLQKRIVLITMLCLATVIAVGCGGAEQRKAKYLARGKEYLTQENYDKADVELKNVIQIDPKNAEAYFLIGQVDEKKQDWQSAFGNYSKAAALKPDYIEPRLRMSYFYLQGGDVDKSSNMLAEVMKAQPNNPGGRTLQAAIMYKKRDIQGATQEAEKIAAEDPSQVDAIELLATIYAGQNNFEKLQEILSKGMAANPKNFLVRQQYAQMLAKRNDIPGAEKVLQESIALQPDNFQLRVSLATFYSQLKQGDKAEKTLRDAIQANPDEAQRYIILADFLISQKKVDLAKEELIAAIKVKPKLYNLRLSLGKLYEETGELDKAAQVYRDTIEASGTAPVGLTAKNQLADLLVRQGHSDEATKLVAEVLNDNPGDNSALFIKGKLALEKRDAQGAITAFQSILHDQPRFMQAYLYLASADMLNKDQALAKENLQKAVELDPKSVEARLAVAKFYAYTGDSEATGKNIDEALKISPNDFNALAAKADFLRSKKDISKKDIKGLQATLEKITTAYPDNAAGYYQLGQLYVFQKKYDSAIHEFELALAKSNNNLIPLTAIVQANLVQHKPEKAIARLNDILKGSPNDPVAREMLGEVFFFQKKYDDAEQYMRKAIEANPQWNEPYISLANIFLVKGDLAAASQEYQQGLKAIPNDESLLMHLGQSYEMAHDYDKAIATYEQVLTKNSANDVAANNLASLLADKADAQSLKRARELAVRFQSSPHPAFVDTLGWVYYKSGDADKALTLFEKVVNQAPAVPIFRYHLGMAYYKKGNLQAAKIQLAKSVAGKGTYPGVEEARATLKQIQ